MNSRSRSKMSGVSVSTPTMKQPHTLTPRLWMASMAAW